MKTCKHCGAQSYRVESSFCIMCGKPLPEQDDDMPRENICTNADCQYHKTKFIYPDDAKFCDGCGSPTVYAL